MYTGSASNSLASKKEPPLEMDDCTITSNKLWFSLSMLLLTPSFQRQMFF
jgi:hypothetical protein